MIRLAVVAEGSTEREFVSRVLAPHLSRHGIAVTKPVDLGGSVTPAKVLRDARLLLQDRSFSHVTTLIDLYGMRDRKGRNAEQIEHYLYENLYAKDTNPSFIPYVQQFEFEALLLADPVVLCAVLHKPGAAAELARVVAECGGPEGVNDHSETCPSRRIGRLLPGFDKKRHGPPVCERLGLAKIRGACPRFGAWLTRLESLGTAGDRATT